MKFAIFAGLGLACALAAGSAFAALAPQYYQRARDGAEDVVVINVSDVDAPPFWRGSGMCRVHGHVASVERGERYRVGQEIDVEVPCVRNWRDVAPGPIQWKEVADLRAAAAGRAFLKDGELALYQYDVLREVRPAR